MTIIKPVIVAVGDLTPTGWPLTLACGHEAKGTAYMAFRVGDRMYCGQCSDAADATR